MKTYLSKITICLVAALILSSSVFAANYAPGELIIRTEKGIIALNGSNEMPLGAARIESNLRNALESCQTNSIERVFKGIFTRPGPQFIAKKNQWYEFEDLSQVYVLKVDQSLDMNEVAKQIEKLPGVIYAHPNYILHYQTAFPIDNNFDDAVYNQWGLYDADNGYDIKALPAWGVETGDPDVLLAIIDSGLEEMHSCWATNPLEDEFHYENRISGEIWVQGNASSYQQTDWSRCHLIDDDFTLYQGGGHGTHVAGIAGASTNNSVYGYDYDSYGTAGVAGGWDGASGVTLLIAKMWPDDGSGQNTCEHLAQAIEWATEKGASVINCSMGGYTEETDEEGRELEFDALRGAVTADVACFFPTGNIPPFTQLPIAFPARFSPYEVCCAVGAMNESNMRWGATWDGEDDWSSCFGNQISFVAPGVNYFSTFSVEAGSPDYYASGTGTSIASAMAAGVGALLYSSANDVGTPLQDVDCIKILERSCVDLSYLVNHKGSSNDNNTWDEVAEDYFWDIYTGFGRVDAYKALQHLYWPYELIHGTITSPAQSVSYDQTVYFWEPPLSVMGNETYSAGEYVCDIYTMTGSVSYASYDNEPIWAWGRILDGAVGYERALSGPYSTIAWFQVDTSGVSTTGATFTTYVYYIKYKTDDPSTPINVWAPRQPSEVQIPYTVIRKEAYEMYSNSSNVVGWADMALPRGHDAPDEVYLTFIKDVLGVPTVHYLYNNFESFSETPSFTPQSASSSSRSFIELDPQGYPHIVYSSTAYLPRHAWQDQTGWHYENISSSQTSNNSSPSIAIDVSGNLHVCFANTSGLFYARKTGGTWTVVPVEMSANISDAVVGLDTSTYTPHVCYIGNSSTLKYATLVSTNWVIETIATSDLIESCNLAFDGKDRANICYYSSGLITGSINCAIRTALNNWTIESVQDEIEGPISWPYPIFKDCDGRIVVMYTNDLSTPNFYSVIEKRQSSGWVAMESYQQGGWFTSLGHDNLNRVVATEIDATSGELNVYRHMRLPQDYNELLSQRGIGIPIKDEATISSIIANQIPGYVSISYDLPAATKVQMIVYDVSGREVKNLYSGQQTRGSHSLIWDGVDNQGHKIPKGVYFVRMTAGNTQTTRKVTILR